MSAPKRDPKEYNPKLKSIIEAAGLEAKKNVQTRGIRGLGMCHAIWGEQKRILKERHGIYWKSPDEMNPDIHFD